MFLEVLSIAASLCAALLACLFHRNIRLYAPPPGPESDTAPPAVVVLIPTRNEAQTISHMERPELQCLHTTGIGCVHLHEAYSPISSV